MLKHFNHKKSSNHQMKPYKTPSHLHAWLRREMRTVITANPPYETR